GRARRRRLHPDADPGRAGVVPGAGVLARLPRRRAAALVRPLLRLPVPLRVLDDGAGAGPQLRPALHLLGAGGPLLLPPDRLLVPATGGGPRGGEGVLGHQGGRRRLPDRHRDAVEPHRHLRLLGAVRDGPGGQRRPHRPRPRDGLHLSRRVGQVGPVPVPHLAARRDGGPDSGLGPHPRRDHGHRGRVHALPRLVPLRADARGAARGGLDRSVHRALRGHDGVRAGRHQAGAGLLHRVPARLHDGRHRGRLRERGVPASPDPRRVQGPAVPGRGRHHPRGGQQRHLRDGGAGPPDAADLRGVPDRDALADRDPVLRRLLLQGGDPGRDVGGRPHDALRDAGAGRVPHRVLHVPGGVHRVLRRPGRRRGGGPGPRRARGPRRGPRPRRARHHDRRALGPRPARPGDRDRLRALVPGVGVRGPRLDHPARDRGRGGGHRAGHRGLSAALDQPRVARPHPVRPGAGLHLRGRARGAPPDGLDAVAAMTLASFPVLSVITWSPFVGALLIMFLARRSALLVRGLAVAATALPLVLSIAIYVAYDREAAGFQFFEDVPLVPALGINYQLGVDGLSLLMVLLTSIIIFAGAFASWTVKVRSQEFYALLLILVTGVYGVFVSLDLFVLFLFYEIAVLPMYLLIGIWGSTGEVRPQGVFGWAFGRTGVGTKEYAAMKLTLYLLFG